MKHTNLPYTGFGIDLDDRSQNFIDDDITKISSNMRAKHNDIEIISAKPRADNGYYRLVLGLKEGMQNSTKLHQFVEASRSLGKNALRKVEVFCVRPNKEPYFEDAVLCSKGSGTF